MPDSSHHPFSPTRGDYRDPLTLIDWPRLEAPGAWLPQSALSLHGLPEFAAAGDEVKRRLSRYEFINVMYCGIWLESIFLQRVSRLLQPDMSRTENAHLLQELREETGHSLMFLRAIDAAGVELPQGSWRAPRAAAILGRYAPAGSAVFWLAMLIGENVSDSLNRDLCESAVDVNPAVRQICMLHVADEARHISHARVMLAAALSSSGAARRALLSSAARVLLWQMASVFYYPPADFYALAGLPRETDWRASALRNPARRRFVAQQLVPTVQLLQSFGLNVRES
ncbi:MAG: diiron oxygenase [Burkholderiales bacterium]|jgi:hypothetical protein|nr:diiron oxygenase [Burkholderiales bacterium]